MPNISNAPLNACAILPSYDRSKLQTKIVHMGFGAFHRAHQALFTDQVARDSDSDWGICEVSLFSDTLIKHLREQDHLFSVIEKGRDATHAKIVGAVTEALNPALDGIQTLIEKMAEPQVAIVSLTITEKGYCIDPSTGALNINNEMVQADLATPSKPSSALGFIVQALKCRRSRDLKPFTVLSCDNIEENGRVAKAAIVDFATQLDPELAAWIAENVSFPSTMVDRIVPAITPESAHEIETLLGVEDPCGIVCETFNQWVIEDTFVAGRPQWERAGVQMVDDVRPYENMKLRMLNGSHSFLAYLGYLAGYAHIADTMQDKNFRRVAYDLMMHEQAPSLVMPEGTDLEVYAQELIARFENPNLKHRTWQIAMDGSQKIPQRICGSLAYHLENGTAFPRLALGLAGWMRYVSGIDEQGNAIDVRDPMAEKLRLICKEHDGDVGVVKALLAVDEIFEHDLATNETLINAVTKAYQSLLMVGAKDTVGAL